MMHTRFFLEVFPIIHYNPICRGEFRYVEQGGTERNFLPLWKDECITLSFRKMKVQVTDVK